MALRQDPQWDEETLEWRNVLLTEHLDIDSTLTHSRYSLTEILGQSITSLADKHRRFKQQPHPMSAKGILPPGVSLNRPSERLNLAEIQTAKN